MTWPGSIPLTTLGENPTFDLPASVGQRVATFRFALTNGVTGEVLGDIHPLRGANLTHDTSRTVKRQLNLSLGKVDTADVNPLTDRINVFMVIGGVEYPLGRYMFVDASRNVFTAGRLGQMQLSDEMFLVDQQITSGITGVGKSVLTTIVDTIAGLPITLLADPTPFDAAAAWGIGTGRGQILEALSVAGDFWCMTPETKILDADLRWRKLGDLVPGDEIIGFDESIAGPSQRYRRSLVESVNRRELECFHVETEFGTTTASADHLWLVKRPVPARTGHRRAWKRTADLAPGDRIVAFGAPWEDDRSRDGGYLAGVCEGSLALPGGRGAHVSKIPRLSFGQKPGLVLDFVRQLLNERGYDYRESKHPTTGVMNLILRGGKYEAMRFLGSIRPERLLPKAPALWEGRGTWSVETAHQNHVPVLSVRPAGRREVVAIGTSTRTLIADGLLTHNSPWFDNQGILRFLRTFDPAAQVPDINLDDGFQVLQASILETDNLLTAPNTFVVISNAATDNTAPVVGIATIPPSAPHSAPNRGFSIAAVFDLQLADATQATAVAQGLAQRQTVFEKVTLATAPDPRHDSYNVIQWQGDRWLELSWSLPLEEGAAMTHTMRRSYGA